MLRRRTNSSNTIDVRGVDVPWSVNELGRFLAEYNGETVDSNTLDGLKDKLRTLARAVPLSIPVVSFSVYSRQTRRGTVTGKHSGNGNLMVVWEGETKAQQHHGYGNILLRGDSDIEALLSLLDAKRKAADDLANYLKEHTFQMPRGTQGKVQDGGN